MNEEKFDKKRIFRMSANVMLQVQSKFYVNQISKSMMCNIMTVRDAVKLFLKEGMIKEVEDHNKIKKYFELTNKGIYIFSELSHINRLLGQEGV